MPHDEEKQAKITVPVYMKVKYMIVCACAYVWVGGGGGGGGDASKEDEDMPLTSWAPGQNKTIQLWCTQTVQQRGLADPMSVIEI